MLAHHQIKSKRIQFAVGQGFFHASHVNVNTDAPWKWSNSSLLYVYDCGAMGKYKSELSREIGCFHSLIDQRKIDILFISHLHYDHISGIEELLGPRDVSNVDTIVLPLIDPVERIIAFSQSLEGDDVSSEFYTNFIVDPVAALSDRFRPRQIILMRRGTGSAPESMDRRPGAPLGPRWPTEEDFGEARLGRVPLDLVGKGEVRRTQETSTPNDGARGEPYIFEMEDTISIALMPTELRPWLLSTYVDEAIIRERNQFLEALAQKLGTTKYRLKKILNTADGRLDILKNQKSALLEAYKMLSLDLNLTSLCLFSGPGKPNTGDRWSACAVSPFLRRPSSRVAWLGTGDADLKTTKRRNGFVKFYRHLLNGVATLTLPHHGSDHNFHSDLLSEISPEIAIVSADAYAKWRHPASSVVQSVFSEGVSFHLATSKRITRFRETIQI